jgi:tetratricopeptide (TPR) repeat protein
MQFEAHARVQHQCSPFFKNSPLHPFIEQIEWDAGFQNEDTAEERLAKLEILLAEATDDVPSIAPLFAKLLTIPLGERHPPATHDPQQQKQLTVEALAKYLLGRARLQPVLIIVEDVHWADPTTLELLQLLIGRVSSEQALLLITFRPDFSVKWQWHPHMTLISLNRLAQRQTTELAKGIAGGAELPDEVFNQILEKTDGVPLFIEEFTKAVLERRRPKEGSDTVRAGPMNFSIPATLHDSLMARLDRLPAARAAAQQAAVIGREFTYSMLAGISQQSETELREALQHLVSSELVYVLGAPLEATYTFKHALVRDAAYESLLKSRRQELHARIAAVLERDYPDVITRQPELIAYHLSEARLAEKAVTYWLLAADAAASRQAHQEAIAHCMKGLELVSRIDDRSLRHSVELRLQVRLGNSATSARGFSAPEVGTALYRARELCTGKGDERALHTILVGLYYFHANKAELREAEKLGLELLALGEARKDRVIQVDAHKILLNARYKLAKFDEARQHFEQGFSLYNESPWPDVSIEHLDDPGPNLLMFGACTLWVMGYPDRAKRAVADAIVLARDGGHHFTIAYTVFMTGHFAELMEDWDAVRRANEETTVLTTEWGLSGLRQHVPRREQLVAIAMNCDQEAMTHKRRHPQPGFARSLHDVVLARAYGRCGEPEEGLQILEGTPAWADETGSRFFDAEVYRARAELLLLAKRLDEAEQSYLEALEIAREQKARMWELRAACDLAGLWRDQSRRAEAHDLLAPIYSWFSEGFSVRDLRAARAVLNRR